MKLTSEQIKKLKKDYDYCGNYAKVYRENMHEMPILKSGPHVAYYINRPYLSTDTVKKFKVENNQDYYWLGYLHKIKPSMTKRYFSIKKFNNDLNEWYLFKTGEEIYSNRISASELIKELNLIVKKGLEDYLSEMKVSERKSFLRGLYHDTILKSKNETLEFFDETGYFETILNDLKPIIFEKKQNKYTIKYKNLEKLKEYLKDEEKIS